MAKEKKEGGNVYDRIFKENAEALFIPLLDMELGIKVVKYTAMQEKITKTIEREMDFFYEVVTDQQETFLLHLEFQVKNDKEMIYRMGEYHSFALRKHKLPMKHVVVYLGESTPTMETELPVEQQFTRYELVNIHITDPNQWLSSLVPEAVILALLSNFEKNKTEEILQTIAERLKEVCKSKLALDKYVRQLAFLLRLRKFEKTVTQIIKDMDLDYNIEDDELYQIGEAKGLAKGEAKGLAKGEAKGLAKGEAKTKQSIHVVKLLLKGISYKEIVALTGFSEVEIEAINKQMEE